MKVFRPGSSLACLLPVALLTIVSTALKHLTNLKLSDSQVTDVGMKALAPVK